MPCAPATTGPGLCARTAMSDRIEPLLSDQATSLFVKAHVSRLERCLQCRNRVVWVTSAAHKNVDCGEIPLRPRVDGNVAFRQHQHATDPTIRREMVEMP